MEPIKIQDETIGRIFPFSILIDGDGTVMQIGPSLLKIAEGRCMIGQPVFDVVKIVKPMRLDRAQCLRDVLGARLVVDVPDRNGVEALKLYGMACPVEVAGAAHVLIVLTPGVNARRFVEVHNLKITDFGPADGSADLLPLLAMQEDMLEDGKRQSAKLRAARDVAEHLANHDVLTELPNRRALMDRLTAKLSRRPLAVMHVDLDKFKEINDTFGHAAGDAALQHAAAGMREALGADALCARLGGDEFVAVLEGEWLEQALVALAHRVIARVSQPFSFMNEALTVTASVGLAVAHPDDGLSADDILHNADLALYEVKRGGRSTAILCTPQLLSAHSEFQQLCADIRRGLSEQEFVAHFQPQVDVRTGALIGFEALARWHHPDRGILPPVDFLNVTHRAGLIQQVDAEIRRHALDALMFWDRSGAHVPKVSLNVTTSDLLDPVFREALLWDLDARELESRRVVLEIVESVLYDENPVEIAQACQSLVDAGFVLALDDFGTGYASILSLVKLPISVVKIDRVFAAGVARSPSQHALTQSMVGMATSLGLEVLAEGVDEADDVADLMKMGCSAFQGYLFGRAMHAPDALTWMVDRSSTQVAATIHNLNSHALQRGG